MRKEIEKWMAYLSMTLFALQVVLFLVSWMTAAAIPMSPVRSLLSAEGVRWFFGTFADNLSNQFLLNIVLLGIAMGAARTGGLLSLIRERHFASYRQRFAVQMVILELIVIVAVMLLLTATPQAILLSATGNLFPSCFSDSIIPVALISLCLFSVTYGVASGTYRSFPDVYQGLTASFPLFVPLLLLYILAVELYYSFCFVYFPD